MGRDYGNRVSHTTNRSFVKVVFLNRWGHRPQTPLLARFTRSGHPQSKTLATPMFGCQASQVICKEVMLQIEQKAGSIVLTRGCKARDEAAWFYPQVAKMIPLLTQAHKAYHVDLGGNAEMVRIAQMGNSSNVY